MATHVKALCFVVAKIWKSSTLFNYSLLSTPSIVGLIILISFWWQDDLRGFLTTNKMFPPLEHRASTAATALWVCNDQYCIR